MLCEFVCFAKRYFWLRCVCHWTACDGLGGPKAWEDDCGLALRLAFPWICWCVSKGCSGGMADDGGPQLPPPQSWVPPVFVGTCIYANLPCKQWSPFKIIGGELPKDNSQVHVAIYQFAFWFEWNSGKLIVVYHCLNEPLLSFCFLLQQ